MLTVTEPASAHLANMLVEAEAPEDVAVRFILQGKGLAMGLDREQPEDDSFDHQGKTVLLMDKQISELLTDKTLDVEDTEEGQQLSLS
ncbi:MAG: hypothetical protein JSV03_15575 [Planctomycetota bacterium]|nr:MAG: hypothetical protein JSV03_15575 [Planctomycetota bacterium]